MDSKQTPEPSSGRFKRLLESSELAVVPACHDPFSALILHKFGFAGACISGYDLGAVMGVTEPLLTATEVLAAARAIRNVTDIPMLVDVGAGFGEPLHLVRLLKEARLIGVDAIQLEDQIYPKRAHYFRDYREHVIASADMKDKIRWAKRAGKGDVIVVARTDAYRTHGAAEGIERCQAYRQAGADAVMAFPNDWDEAHDLPKRVDAPVVYVNTHGNRVGRPILTPQQANSFGYSMLVDAHVLLFAAFDAMVAAARLYSVEQGWQLGDAIGTRQHIEDVLELRSLYEIESATVEPDAP
jgi:methylisocitrate lyase